MDTRYLVFTFADSYFSHLSVLPASTAGMGIRVSIKPEYRITPPVRYQYRLILSSYCHALDIIYCQFLRNIEKTSMATCIFTQYILTLKLKSMVAFIHLFICKLQHSFFPKEYNRNFLFFILHKQNIQPEMFPQAKEVPQSKFHFDFEFEKKFLAEIEKNGFCNWSKFSSEYQPLKDPIPSKSSMVCLSPHSVQELIWYDECIS